MTTPAPKQPDTPIVVQKYGGSSLSDPEALKRVAAGIAERVQEGARLVVVVSAMGGSTDDLIKLARQVSPAPKRRELDMLLSTGERVTMALLSMAIADQGVEAISFTGSQCGIITNDRHTDARIIEVRPVRVEDELARNRVVIVAGFQGMSYTREITTLGRGGSDTTALALAAALGASACEIYSDVPGVFSADPRHVSGAHPLENISYGSLETMALYGAKVLHADAVAWARRAGIQFRARQTGNSSRGTHVGAFEHKGIQAVTSSKNRAFLIQAQGRDRYAKALIHASDQGWLINTENLHGEQPGQPCFTLSVVGERLLEDPSVLEAFLQLIDGAEAWWSTPHGLHARLSPQTDLPDLTQRAHDRFVGA